MTQLTTLTSPTGDTITVWSTGEGFITTSGRHPSWASLIHPTLTAALAAAYGKDGR